MLVTPKQALNYGLSYLGVKDNRWSEATRELCFHEHYGSSPLDIADLWFDLASGDCLPEKLRLEKKEKCEKGFKYYMIAHFFLWAYPKNARMISSRFHICKNYCEGKHMWKWIKRIAALKVKKIKWEHVSDPKHLEILAISTDGTDFKLRETKHESLPRDPKLCSHKFNGAAVKYEIALSLHRAKCVHLAGPYKGGVHDLTIFRESGLKQKLLSLNRTVRGVRRVKLTLADAGYSSSEKDEVGLFSVPNPQDPQVLARYKSRGRLRHETFNGRLKFFGSLSNPFRHGFHNHKHVMEAVVVIVQTQMDNGSPIFAI